MNKISPLELYTSLTLQGEFLHSTFGWAEGFWHQRCLFHVLDKGGIMRYLILYFVHVLMQITNCKHTSLFCLIWLPPVYSALYGCYQSILPHMVATSLFCLIWLLPVYSALYSHYQSILSPVVATSLFCPLITHQSIP